MRSRGRRSPTGTWFVFAGERSVPSPADGLKTAQGGKSAKLDGRHGFKKSKEKRRKTLKFGDAADAGSTDIAAYQWLGGESGNTLT